MNFSLEMKPCYKDAKLVFMRSTKFKVISQTLCFIMLRFAIVPLQTSAIRP